MKLERLLSIVMLLLNRRLVQAKELADIFEVSVRTIYRDIESLNLAGIPIVTHQGANGGISLVEGYKLDRNVLTHDELASIVTALQSISTSHHSTATQLLLEKISSVIPASDTEEFRLKTKQFIVDYSAWGEHKGLEEKISLIKQAIEKQQGLKFIYCSAGGEVTERSVDPYTLVLKRNWYLYAFCQKRQQFRMFKLYRMKDVELLKDSFDRQDISLEGLPWQKEWYAPDKVQKVVLRFTSKAKQVAEEWFGIDHVTEAGADQYIASAFFPEDQWLYGFILSFGQEVEVLEPEHLRIKIKEIAENIVKLY